MRRALMFLFQPVLAHPKAFAAMNALYFGTLLLGIAYTAIDQQAQQALLESVGTAFSPTGSLRPIAEAYLEGRLPQAIALTFLVNLFGGSLLFLTLPSVVLPFAGVALGLLRAFIWGVLFSPLGGIYNVSLLPHIATILLEGEGYVVAITGVAVWWWGVATARGSRWQAWLDGLRLQWRIYLLAGFVLALAAVYEALEVIYLVPRLM